MHLQLVTLLASLLTIQQVAALPHVDHALVVRGTHCAKEGTECARVTGPGQSSLQECCGTGYITCSQDKYVYFDCAIGTTCSGEDAELMCN